MRVRKLKSRLITLGTPLDVYRTRQLSISNFCAPPRTTRHRFAAYTHQDSDPAPRVKRPASRLTIFPAHVIGFAPLWDYVDRVRKGSFGVFTENPDSQGWLNEFLPDFYCFCIVFHHFHVRGRRKNVRNILNSRSCTHPSLALYGYWNIKTCNRVHGVPSKKLHSDENQRIAIPACA